MAVGKGVNPGPSVPTRIPRGNVSARPGSVRGVKVGSRPVPDIPAKRAAPPPQASVPTRAPRGNASTRVSGVPATARKPTRTNPGTVGQPVVSRGTVGSSAPTPVRAAPPQKKGSPAVVGGGTVGTPVAGTRLGSMKSGALFQKGGRAAPRLSNPTRRGK